MLWCENYKFLKSWNWIDTSELLDLSKMQDLAARGGEYGKHYLNKTMLPWDFKEGKEVQNSGINLNSIVNSMKTFKLPLYNYVQC